MNLAEVAYRRLFPGKPYSYSFRLRYSGRFSGFNGNVSKSGSAITVSLSKSWRGVNSDIQVGIIQELYVKLFKMKVNTLEMDLYSNFLRSVHSELPKTRSHPVLAASFKRVNSRFFSGLVETPNLVLSNGTSLLGFYDYGRDQISISRILLKDEELLDFVMYHEMLHKCLKFRSSSGRTNHHTKEFREAERRFPGYEECERRLNRLVRRSKWQSLFTWNSLFS